VDQFPITRPLHSNLSGPWLTSYEPLADFGHFLRNLQYMIIYGWRRSVLKWIIDNDEPMEACKAIVVFSSFRSHGVFTGNQSHRSE
jgi:hypothetical protein